MTLPKGGLKTAVLKWSSAAVIWKPSWPEIRKVTIRQIKRKDLETISSESLPGSLVYKITNQVIAKAVEHILWLTYCHKVR